MNEYYPEVFLKSMNEMLDSEYPAFESSLMQASQPALRINSKRAGVRDDLAATLTASVAWEPNGYYVSEGFHPGNDPIHFAGGYYMQDASAMAPAKVLDVHPGQRVLDLCAAPGGKSGQLALALNGQGILVANEPDFKRAQILSGNLERLGAINCVVTSAYPDRLSQSFHAYFDAILVDAPCSGEGMFRKDPLTRAQWSPDRALGCVRRQREILSSAAIMLAPGGRLVYSTCTFNRHENEENAHWFLENHEDFSALAFTLPRIGSSENGCLRLWPHKVRGEGHFIAGFQRAGQPRPRDLVIQKPEPQAQAALDALRNTLPGDWFCDLAHLLPRVQGDCLWAVPNDMPDMHGIKCLRFALALARLGKNYVQPDHALSMAIDPACFPNRLELTADQAAHYLKGNVIEAENTGWTLVTHHNLALGWGKGSNGQVKNHLPKGLRR